MADLSLKLEHLGLAEASDDDDEKVALVTAAAKPAVSPVKKVTAVAPPAAASVKAPTATKPVIPVPADSDEEEEEEDDEEEEDEDEDLAMEVKPALGIANDDDKDEEIDSNGMLVLALLDKIIGVVDQIQQTQNGLEARQTGMEKSVGSIQSDLTKLAKNHTGTSNTVNKLMDKLRKVNTNVKGVRGELDKQAGQIKKLESNEHELLRRKNFKVMIYQEKPLPEKKPEVKEEEKAKQKVGEEGEVPANGEEVEQGSDEEGKIKVSRVKQLKHSGRQGMDNIKKAFSKENMEKTKLKTKENLEKTQRKTKDNLKKTQQNFNKTSKNLKTTIGKLGTEHKKKLQKSLNRPKNATYRVPPFTFHVKKIREGQMEVENMEVEKPTNVAVVAGGLEEVDEDENLQVEVEETVLFSTHSPEMEAVLEVADSSKLVLVDTDLPKQKKGKK